MIEELPKQAIARGMLWLSDYVAPYRAHQELIAGKSQGGQGCHIRRDLNDVTRRGSFLS